ncbi:unnamed protein product [Gordionus sp. m RMFG-2023]
MKQDFNKEFDSGYIATYIATDLRVQSSPPYLPISNLKDQTIPLLDQVQSLTYLPISNFQDQTIQLLD